MSTPTVYTIRRGQTAVFYMEAVAGDPTTASQAAAKLKPIASPTSAAPDPSIPAALTIAPVPALAAGSIAAGWTITITADQSAGLAAGFYLMDFTCVVGGAQIVTDPVVVQLINAVSAP